MKRRHYLATCSLTAVTGCLSGRREGRRSERVPGEEPSEAKPFGDTDRDYTLAFGEWFVHGYDATRIDRIHRTSKVPVETGDTIRSKTGTQFVFIEATKKNLDDTEWRLWFSSDWAVMTGGTKSDFGDYETATAEAITSPTRYPQTWIGPDEHREISAKSTTQLWAVTSIGADQGKSSIDVAFAASSDEENHNVRWTQTK